MTLTAPDKPIETTTASPLGEAVPITPPLVRAVAT